MISKLIVRTGWLLHARMLRAVELQLKRLPVIVQGVHCRNGREHLVLRVSSQVNGTTIRKEYSISSSSGKQHLSTFKRITFLKKLLAELMQDDQEMMLMISDSDNAVKQQVSLTPGNQTGNSPFSFTFEEWNNLVELNDQDIQAGYRHGNRLFRSKSEMLIAQILESLGLEYKYEPIVEINGLTRYPDFAVYCPETGRYFFIEHLGRMDDPKYRFDNLSKIDLYESNGIRNGVDIIYNTEFGRGNFTTTAVYGKIMGILFAHSHVLVSTQG